MRVMREGYRTIVLIGLILFALAFIIWSRRAYEVNFLQSL